MTTSAASYGLIKSSIGRKIFMALTGLFLCIFLVGHLTGNLQLFISGETGRHQFNEYALFMTTNPMVKLLSYLTYFAVLFHTIDGLVLTIRNRSSRRQKYYKKEDSANSIFSSRNMGILGTIILIYIVAHMMNFWYVMHWGPIEKYITPSGQEVKDIHTVVIKFFTDPEMGIFFVGLYVVSMIALGFHLLHGFQSGFQSLGLNHPAYTPAIKKVGVAFAVLIPLLFAIIPVYIFMTN